MCIGDSIPGVMVDFLKYSKERRKNLSGVPCTKNGAVAGLGLNLVYSVPLVLKTYADRVAFLY